MPIISQFFGIVIQMFWREHAPPHFHALYAEQKRSDRYLHAQSHWWMTA